MHAEVSRARRTLRLNRYFVAYANATGQVEIESTLFCSIGHAEQYLNQPRRSVRACLIGGAARSRPRRRRGRRRWDGRVGLEPAHELEEPDARGEDGDGEPWCGGAEGGEREVEQE